MSSSYSSLDWVLSHWADHTVCIFIYVYDVCVFCVFFVNCVCVILKHGEVDLMGSKPNP